MLFNSWLFIFIFLPVTLFVFYTIGGSGHHRSAIAWLVGASLFFYGWWNPIYVGLILASMLFNYGFGANISRKELPLSTRKQLLILGIVLNLGFLGYFKYANFFVDNINSLFGLDFNLEKIILPLAISFFTFQQIAYLVDTYKGETKEYNFLHYCLFVLFFPQLIAGPIVHHREMLPQFAKEHIYLVNYSNLTIGITIFAIGLFKKVVLADNLSLYVSPVFNAAAGGYEPSLLEAWGASLAYTFQLYFDFSGYADMAIGIARMFGIRLPLNFDSPYKAVNIIDFWRRWHMTLSRFLRDYLYIPLGGNRKGKIRRYVNLFTTMLLGGLWHGAGWTFVLWGALHGFYLIINHAWLSLRKSFGADLAKPSLSYVGFARITTFLAVVVGWVFFRSDNVDTATSILNGMIGLNGVHLPTKFSGIFNHVSGLGDYLQASGIQFSNPEHFGGTEQMLLLFVCLVIAFVFPNTQQIMAIYKPALEKTAPGRFLIWRPTLLWSVTIGLLLTISISRLTNITEFLYFQF